MTTNWVEHVETTIASEIYRPVYSNPTIGASHLTASGSEITYRPSFATHLWSNAPLMIARLNALRNLAEQCAFSPITQHTTPQQEENATRSFWLIDRAQLKTPQPRNV